MTALKANFLDSGLIDQFATYKVTPSGTAGVVLFEGTSCDWHCTYGSVFSMKYNNKDCLFIDVARLGARKSVDVIKSYYAGNPE